MTSTGVTVCHVTVTRRHEVLLQHQGKLRVGMSEGAEATLCTQELHPGAISRC